MFLNTHIAVMYVHKTKSFLVFIHTLPQFHASLNDFKGLDIIKTQTH